MISDLLRWYFVISPETADGTFQWSWRSALGTQSRLWLCGVVAVTLIVFVYRSAQHGGERGFRFVSHCLVVLVIGGLLTLMSSRSELEIRFPGTPRLLLLIDTSASMGQADTVTDAERESRSAGLPPLESSSRLDRFRDLLVSEPRQMLSELCSRFELTLAEFDTDVSLLETPKISPMSTSQTQFDDDIQIVRSQLQAFTADGPDTDLAATLNRVLDLTRRQRPDAIVMVSDGNPTLGTTEATLTAARVYGKRQLPIHCVGMGSEEPPADVSIVHVRHDPLGFAGLPISLDVELSREGRESAVVVRLTSPDGQTIHEEQIVDWPESTPNDHVVLSTPALQDGWNTFQVSATGDGRDFSPFNNERMVRAWGHNSRLNVLLISRLASWEFHHLKQVLERDRNVDVQMFLTEADPEYAVEDAAAIARPPQTVEDWDQFDVVILGDADLPRGGESVFPHLKQFVADGGGLCLLAGSDSIQSWQATVLAPLLPVESVTPPIHDELRQWSVTNAGRTHQLFSGRLADHDEWITMLSTSSVRANGSPRSPAEVLLVAEESGQVTPMVIQMRYGRGQVVLQLFDEAWRMRSIDEGRLHRAYWQQMVRFLGQQRLENTRPPYQLSIDRQRFSSTEPVRLELSARNPLGAPPTIQLFSSNQEQKLELRLVGPETYENTLSDLPPGTYRARFQPDNEVQSAVEVTWTVVSRSAEQIPLPLNRRILDAISRESGGITVLPEEWDLLLATLPVEGTGAVRQSRVIPLWNRWEPLTLLVFCLGIDWWIRRQGGFS